MHLKACLQGHIRIVLLPVIYNIMAAKEEYWHMPLFKALETALGNSTYCPLLQDRKKEQNTAPNGG